MTIASLLAAYRSGESTPRDVVNAVYDRIDAGPLHPVWISVVPREQALAQAASLSASSVLPLYGVPFAVKDNFDVAGMQTTAGCPAFAYTPDETASVLSRLQKAGAILIGKTNLDQFATGLSGTRSPYGACSSVFGEKHISGGSSSGSAVAVARGLAAFALGTDTAGSGRVPAAFNNLVGLKPSRGLLSTAGVVPACRSFDCVSIFAADYRDAGIVFDAAAGFDSKDIYSRNPQAPERSIVSEMRVGMPTTGQLQFFGNNEYKTLFAETVSALRSTGVAVIEIDIASFLEAGKLLYSDAFVAERYAAVGEFVESHRGEVNETVGAIITEARKWSAADLFRAQYKLKELEQRSAVVWTQVDALLLPTAPTTYTIAEMLSNPIELNSRLGTYTNFVNLLDLCAVAVPAGFTRDRMPFGVSVIAPALQDRSCLQLASRIQELRGAHA